MDQPPTGQPDSRAVDAIARDGSDTWYVPYGPPAVSQELLASAASTQSGRSIAIPSTLVAGLAMQVTSILVGCGYGIVAAVMTRDLATVTLYSTWNLAVAGLAILLVYRIATGRDWPRLIMLNLTMVACVATGYSVLVARDHGTIYSVLSILLRATELASLVLLFAPPSSRWLDAKSE